MAKEFAIVMTNGSINSAVVTAMAAQKFRPIFMFANIGAGDRVKAAYDLQVAHFKPYREYTVPMTFPGGATPQSNASAADPRQAAPLAPQMLELLPMIATAARLAVHHQAAAIYLGMRVGPTTDELAQATEYIQIWNEMIQIPCGQPELEIIAPILELEPWQVVDVGFQVNAPFDKTWSCIEETAEPCLACKGCRAREAAFQQAGKPDPIRAPRKV